jgi:hypothetical protein
VVSECGRALVWLLGGLWPDERRWLSVRESCRGWFGACGCHLGGVGASRIRVGSRSLGWGQAVDDLVQGGVSAQFGGRVRFGDVVWPVAFSQVDRMSRLMVQIIRARRIVCATRP